MDISSITNQYITNISQQSTSGARISNSVSSTDYTKSTDFDMLKACKDFEAYFLEQVFKEMEKTVDCFKEEGSTSNYSSSMTDFFKDQTLQSISAQSTETQGLGLAQSLYQQMKRNYSM